LSGKVGGVCQEIRSIFRSKLGGICGEFAGNPEQKGDRIGGDLGKNLLVFNIKDTSVFC